MKTKPNMTKLSAPSVINRSISQRRVSLACRGESATKAIGKMEHGCEIFGFTKGQFSLIHLLDAVIEQVGPSDVVIATWSAADGDVEHAKQWIDAGRVKSLKMLVDFSFQSRKPDVCDALRARFGDDSLRVTVTHAKFVLVKSSKWNIVIRTSMNLTHNPRFENFEISDDPQMYAFMQSIIDETWSDQSISQGFTQKPADNRKQWKHSFPTALELDACDGRDLL